MSTEPESPDDAEVMAFFARLARSMRASVARALLAGNDVGCFTTEQYQAAYDRLFPLTAVAREVKWSHTSPERHLRSIPHVVREVAPGVWAAAEVSSGGRVT